MLYVGHSCLNLLTTVANIYLLKYCISMHIYTEEEVDQGFSGNKSVESSLLLAQPITADLLRSSPRQTLPLSPPDVNISLSSEPLESSSDKEVEVGMEEPAMASSVNNPHTPLPSSSAFHSLTSCPVQSGDKCRTALGDLPAQFPSLEEGNMPARSYVGCVGDIPVHQSSLGVGDSPGHCLSASAESMEVLCF